MQHRSSRRSLSVLILCALLLASGFAPNRAAAALTSQTAATDGQILGLLGYFGGEVWEVLVHEGHLYAGVGLRMMIFDISAPASPVVVGRSPLFLASVAGIAVRESLAYVVDESANLYILDVSNPASPVQIGSLAAPISFLYGTTAYEIALSGDYALIANGDDGLLVVDVSNPAAPQKLITPQPLSECFGVTVQGSYVYTAAGQGGLVVVDASNPYMLRVVGQVDTPGSARKVSVAGDYAYIADDWAGMRVASVANPASPALVGAYTTTTGSDVDIAVAGSYAYVSEWEGVRVISVATPSNPVGVGFTATRHYPKGLAVSAGYVFAADYAGISILNAANAAAIHEAGYYASLVSVDSVDTAGSLAYVASEFGLTILDFSDPGDIRIAGAYPCYAYDVDVVFPYAYVGTDAELLILNVADPRAIGVAGRALMEPAVTKVAVYGSYAYVGDHDEGLAVIDIANPSAPARVDLFPISAVNDRVRGIAFHGDTAFVASDVLYVLDISDPRDVTEITRYTPPDPNGLTTVAVAYPYVYAAQSGEGGILALDISALPAIAQAGYYPGYSSAEGIWAEGLLAQDGYLLAAGMDMYWVNKVLALDVFDPAAIAAVDAFQTGAGRPGLAKELSAAGDLLVTAAGHNGLYVHRAVYPGPFSAFGKVADFAGAPFNGVTLTADTGQTAVTDALGAYELEELAPGTHVITPTLAGYIFSPASRTVSGPPDVTGQAFTILTEPVSATVAPAADSLLVYTDTQQLATSIAFPAGAVETPVTVVLTPTVESNSADLVFAGHAFELDVFEDGVLVTDFSFASPVTLTVAYSDADLRLVADESELWIGVLEAGVWIDAALTCDPPSTYVRDLDANVLSIAVCHFSEYGLFGPAYALYMPVVMR